MVLKQLLKMSGRDLGRSTVIYMVAAGTQHHSACRLYEVGLAAMNGVHGALIYE